MMRPVGEVKVYLHREPIDMRRGRNGLAALVREAMQQDPFAPEALYVFVGRRYDTLKILGWDRQTSAFWLFNALPHDVLQSAQGEQSSLPRTLANAGG